MEDKILGIHHITAIAGEAQRNFDFYTKVLGLRLVKKTVNFDDPHTYHFYYGNENGTPGTILTFFPWTHVHPGRLGTGMATDIGYAVPTGSLDFWGKHFEKHAVRFGQIDEQFGEQILRFEDPDGLRIQLVEASADNRTPWETSEIKKDTAIKGFHSIVLTLRNIKPTASILTDIFGYKLLKQEGNRYRFVTDAIENAAIVDLVEEPEVPHGLVAGGTNHHVAFRVKNDQLLMQYREKIASKGYNITPKIDRNYFYSLYFREPGGVLFELATDNPGFAVDEPVNELGTHLKLPVQYESDRETIEKVLPKLVQ
ncbi:MULTISPECIES: ring-cleaving dioxygenase [Niastella]|uniref:Ring-cleaving dioxygenase n=1 Tax=Niastella soli TaxID=2821487 RepID=A0ABS3Z0W5_9BACT|nr:ring-cleaving dioxygenase [Niastella soli]MBO9203739.1 ring-cleaving dioxygenase [Niastella soli]